MDPKEFAEVRTLLRKKKTTKEEDNKIMQAYECFVAILGKRRIKYLCKLVDQDKPVISALNAIK